MSCLCPSAEFSTSCSSSSNGRRWDVCICQRPRTLGNLLHPRHGKYDYVCEEIRIWCLRGLVRKDGLWIRRCCSEGDYGSDRRTESDPPFFLIHLILYLLVYRALKFNGCVISHPSIRLSPISGEDFLGHFPMSVLLLPALLSFLD